jgi:hypothetical protein
MMATGNWQPMESAPRDGTEILCVSDSGTIRVCYPKLFPRPLKDIIDVNNIESLPGDTWEYFRDDVNAPGHSWSMVPVAWMPLPAFEFSDNWDDIAKRTPYHTTQVFGPIPEPESDGEK